MWRPAQGATSRPAPNRPASGYGRVLGRPGPGSWIDPAHDEAALDPAAFTAAFTEPLVGEQESEASAPVTP